MDRKADSFIKGALILSIATLVSRVLGAFYRPITGFLFAPYDGLGGERGLGLTNMPLQVYNVILSFTAVGLNVGISKLIAERLALQDVPGAQRVFRYSLYTMGALGVTGTLAIWLGADALALAMASQESATGFRAMSLAVFFVTLMAAFRGLFQGFQNMAPNAISQLIEQLIRIFFGIVLVAVLVRHSVAWGAAGFNLADAVGAVAGLIYLTVLYRRSRGAMWSSQVAATSEGTALPQSELSAWEIMRRVFAVSLPIAVIGAILPLMFTAEGFIVPQGLMAQGVPKEAAQAAYGQLGIAQSLILLPSVFSFALYTSMVPAMAESMAIGNLEQARSRSRVALRITAVLAWPSMVGLFLLADRIYYFLFPAGGGGPVLAASATAVVFMLVQQTSSGILQGGGRVMASVRNQLIATGLKVGLTYVWVHSMGTVGAAFATTAAFSVAAALNLWDLQRMLGRAVDWSGMVLKPGLAAAGMGAALWGLIVLIDPYAGMSRVVTLGLISAGVLVYGVMLVLVGGVQQADLERIPRLGAPLVRALRRFRLLR